LLGALERSAAATPPRLCACLAADTFEGSARPRGDSCPVWVTRAARCLDSLGRARLATEEMAAQQRGDFPRSRAATRASPYRNERRPGGQYVSITGPMRLLRGTVPHVRESQE
jgi:hypothetical protein